MKDKETDISDIDLYANCMEVIKKRLDVIHKFTNKSKSTGFVITDVEFIALQFRKTLEQIALANLVANKREYASQNNKFKNHWNAKRILKDLERINNNFYPLPNKQIRDEASKSVIRIEDLTEGFLTKEDFIHVYDYCSKILHTENPYAVNTDWYS